MLNVEENLWNVKSTSKRIDGKVNKEDYRAQYPCYFRK